LSSRKFAEQNKARSALWYAKNREAVRATAKGRHYERQFGITQAQYDEMLIQQEGVCAICRRPQSGRNRLAVDHDHNTGKVRGLLCSMCNAALGWYEKRPRKIEDYLVKNH
jgi:hypothetical protein